MTRIHIIHTEPRHLHRQAPPRDFLCKKDVGGFSRLISKTRKLFARKLGFNRGSAPPYRSQWSGGGGRNVMWSGPIDRRLMAAARCQSAVFWAVGAQAGFVPELEPNGGVIRQLQRISYLRCLRGRVKVFQ